jgi:iron complex outermembrane receptor protein
MLASSIRPSRLGPDLEENLNLSRKAATLGSLGLLMTAAGFAQQLTVSGTVRDISGAVPEASVSLTAPGGMALTSVTGGQGEYKFENLSAGPYQLSVSRQGFETANRSFTLSGESRIIDVTLALAGVTSSIDVMDVGGKSTLTRMDVPDREIPSQVSVISQQTLKEQGIIDLASALANASGVTTQVQYGVYEWYTIGGFTQQSGNDFLYVDGMTMTGNRSNTLLNNIEEVQVMKGPSAVMYGGAGAGQGGMVNVIRKKPQGQRTHDLLYRAGQWGQQYVAAGSAGQVFGLQRLLYRADAAFYHSDGWRDTGSSRLNISPALTWLITDRMRITGNQTFVRDRYTLDAGVPVALLAIKNFPLGRKVNPEGDFQTTRDWQTQIVFNANITNRLQLRNSFFKQKKRDQYLDAETLSYAPATDLLSRTYLYFQHNRRPVQNQTDFMGDYTVFGMRHRFLVGYDYQDQYNYSNRTGTAPNTSTAAGLPITPIPVASFISGTFVDTTPEYMFFPRTRVDYSTNATNSVAWQDQIDLTRRLKINIAGRYDDYKRAARNDVWNNDVFVSQPLDTLRHQTNYNYRYGAVYQFTDSHAAYFSTATSFSPVNTIPLDGSELLPIKGKSYEIGHKFVGFNRGLIINTGLRRIQRMNDVITISTGVFSQAGKAESKVIESDIEGNLSHGIRATANYGFADARYDAVNAPPANRAKRLANAPRHSARAWLTKTWRIKEETSLITSLGARYINSYYTNATSTVMIPSLFNMSAAVGIGRKKWDATLNMENLTDKQRYFVSQINGGNQLYPGAPFNAFVTLRYRFD